MKRQAFAALFGCCVCFVTALWAPLVAADEMPSEEATPADEVRAAESGFAAAFADRDFERFSEFVADDAVFASGADSLVGKEAVLAEWKKYFETPEPPFSWRPDRVLANPGGELGATTGPVFLPDGTQAGAFASTWRKDDEGWRVIFDVSPPCPRPEP